MAMRHCNQCGDDERDDKFREGVCIYCWQHNQNALDQHNAENDRWQAMSDDERYSAIFAGIPADKEG